MEKDHCAPPLFSLRWILQGEAWQALPQVPYLWLLENNLSVTLNAVKSWVPYHSHRLLQWSWEMVKSWLRLWLELFYKMSFPFCPLSIHFHQSGSHSSIRIWSLREQEREGTQLRKVKERNLYYELHLPQQGRRRAGELHPPQQGGFLSSGNFLLETFRALGVSFHFLSFFLPFFLFSN